MVSQLQYGLYPLSYWNIPEFCVSLAPFCVNLTQILGHNDPEVVHAPWHQEAGHF